MSREWILKTLLRLGFTEEESQVYVFLVTEEASKQVDIMNALQMNRKKFYRCLSSLQSKGLMKPCQDYPVHYKAVPFEEALDVLIKVRSEQKKNIQESREELISNWKALTQKDEPSKANH